MQTACIVSRASTTVVEAAHTGIPRMKHPSSVYYTPTPGTQQDRTFFQHNSDAYTLLMPRLRYQISFGLQCMWIRWWPRKRSNFYTAGSSRMCTSHLVVSTTPEIRGCPVSARSNSQPRRNTTWTRGSAPEHHLWNPHPANGRKHWSVSIELNPLRGQQHDKADL